MGDVFGVGKGEKKAVGSSAGLPTANGISSDRSST
jgi:hypothetical protein